MEAPTAAQAAPLKLLKRAMATPVSMSFVSCLRERLAHRDENKLAIAKKDLKLICDTFIETIIDHVMDGENVKFANCMSFKRVLRKARTHKRPNSKPPVSIVKPAHYAIKMDVMPLLKRQFEVVEVNAEDMQETKKNVPVPTVVPAPEVVAAMTAMPAAASELENSIVIATGAKYLNVDGKDDNDETETENEAEDDEETESLEA